MAREIKVSLLGDTKSLERAFSKAGSSGSRLSSGMGKVSHGLGTVVKGAALAGAAVAGLGIIIGTKLIQDMANQQKASVQTNAVIASTGKAANVTRKHVEDLATAIQNKSGLDDQAVQSGENMLLTFTNIRNETGKGNKIFDQSTKILADMSVALGQDMSKSAIQLGKALNDPVKGMTALQRVGVTFTEDQKKQVAAMIKAGDTMGAQKLILKELNKEFGGSAAAMGQSLPGKINILKGRLMDLGSTLLTAALPALNKLTKGAIEVVQAIQQHMPEIKAAWAKYGAPVFAAIITAGEAVAKWTRENWPQIKATIKAVIDWIGTNIVPTVRSVVNNMIALWNKFGKQIMAVVKPALEALRAIIQAVLAVIRGDWSQAWANMKVALSKAWQAFKAILVLGVAAIKAIAKRIGPAILDGLKALPGLLYEAGRGLAFKLGDGIMSGLGGIQARIKKKLGSVLGFSLTDINIPGASPPEHAAAHLVGEPLGRGIILGFLAGIASLPDKISGKIKASLESARSHIDGLRSSFSTSFGRLGADAMSAFDATTTKKLDGIAAKFQKWRDKAAKDLAGALSGIDANQRDLTPSEQALQDLQGSHDQASRNADLARGQADLAAATTPEDQAAAQKEIDDAVYNQRIFDLGVLAAAERAKVDADAETARAKLQAAYDQQNAAWDAQQANEALDLQSQRDLKKRHLEDMLADLQENLSKHPKAWRKAHAKIMKIFDEEFGPDFKAAGESLGTGFRESLIEDFKVTGALLGNVGAAIRNALSDDNVNAVGVAAKAKKMAAGGVTTRPTFALIGEAGPEAVIPLSRLGGVGGGGGTTVNVTVNGWVGNDQEIADRVRNALIRTGRNTSGGALGRFA